MDVCTALGDFRIVASLYRPRSVKAVGLMGENLIELGYQNFDNLHSLCSRLHKNVQIIAT